MKKSILCYITAIIMLFAVSCSESYDDSTLVGRVDNLENRVAKLEELCKQMNTNISSLQALVTALQNNDYVTGVTPITKKGETIGYTITFTKSQPITIYHGEDGKDGQNGADGKDGVDGIDGQDGHTPIIGVKQDTDGIYYWTLDGDWLLDDNGNKIKAQGTDGKDGADGKDGVDGTDGKDGEDGEDGKDGITPILKIENDYWHISYDNGKTWTKLSKAKGDDGQDGTDGTNGTNGIDGEDGDSFFQNVDTTNNDYVIFTLADGTELAIPRFKNLSISFDIANGAACMPSTSIKVGYTLSGADSGTTIETIGDGGWKSVVTKTSTSEGYITVTAPENGGDGKVVMLATTSTGYTAMKAICFEEGVVAGINDAYQVGYEESTLKIKLKTNLAYTVSIPNNAKSWISVADTRATMRTETLTFTIKENPEDSPARSATIKLLGECGDILQSFVIMQDLRPSSDPIVFADANVKATLIEQYDTNGDGEISYKEAKTVQKFSFTFPSTIKTFDELQYFTSIESLSGFWGCIYLNSIKLPNNLKVIDFSCFRECRSLTNIIIPNSVTEISTSAFYGCTQLTDITLSENIITFGHSAFNGCKALKTITIPNRLSSIDNNAFYGCESLFAIYGEQASTDNRCIIIDGKLRAFAPANLTEYHIPNSVKTIGENVFWESKLETVYIPNSVTNIESAAFHSAKINNLYCEAQTPPILDSASFELSNLSKIYVPIGCENIYKYDPMWREYADIIYEYDFNE